MDKSVMKRSTDTFGNPIHLYIPPEDDEGAVEYKWKLIDLVEHKKQKLASQMRWRCREASNGSALYVIGAHDNGKITGVEKDELIETYLNLMAAATGVSLYLCVRGFYRLPDHKMWGILQVFTAKNKCRRPYEIPDIPYLVLPEYLRKLSRN